MSDTLLVNGGCPCGSGQAFANCCGPYLDGATVAPSAEALMRSRYTAYVRADVAYLNGSWDPATRPASLDLDQGPRWCGLEIIHCDQGHNEDDTGRVEFIASYLDGEHLRYLHEISSFVRHEGHWLYREGDIQPGRAAIKPGRNEPCPCGSGKKYKRCCAR